MIKVLDTTAATCVPLGRTILFIQGHIRLTRHRQMVVLLL